LVHAVDKCAVKIKQESWPSFHRGRLPHMHLLGGAAALKQRQDLQTD
jgi:hypothetical protein